MDIRKWSVAMLIGGFLLFLSPPVAEEPKSAAAEGGAQKAARPLVTLTGSDSRVTARSYYLVRSDKEWTQTWRRHRDAASAEDHKPQINFDKCMVIAVFQGSGWNSRGLTAVALQESNERIVLQFENNYYQSDGEGDRVTVYGFFVLPRSDKTVTIEEDVRETMGPPPVWKERARFPKSR
jgi:hypothetical protein